MSDAPLADLARTSADPLACFAEQQTWISPELEVRLQTGAASAFNAIGGNPFRRFLHGDWLNVPLHTVLTDLPIGSWTATIAFDALAAISTSPKLDTAADATNAFGLITATLAATTGLNDWSEIRKPPARRIGLIHGVLNLTAAGLFLSSCIARRRLNRPTARALAALGYVIVATSAHLGDTLVKHHGIGVAPNPHDIEVTHDIRT